MLNLLAAITSTTARTRQNVFDLIHNFALNPQFSIIKRMRDHFALIIFTCLNIRSNPVLVCQWLLIYFEAILLYVLLTNHFQSNENVHPLFLRCLGAQASTVAHCGVHYKNLLFILMHACVPQYGLKALKQKFRRNQRKLTYSYLKGIKKCSLNWETRKKEPVPNLRAGSLGRSWRWRSVQRQKSDTESKKNWVARAARWPRWRRWTSNIYLSISICGRQAFSSKCSKCSYR